MLAAVLGFVAAITLIVLRVPIAIALGMTGFVGFGLLVGFRQAAAMMAIVTKDASMSYTLAVIALFVLMGNLIIGAGVSREIFRCAQFFMGHWRGGLAMAAITATAGFATVCGSTIATVVTIGKISMPSLKGYGYRDNFSAAAVAAGSTLGIMIPPSTLMVVYCILTETNIGKLYAAALIPSVVGLIGYLVAVRWVVWRDPESARIAPRASWREALQSLRPIWSVGLLFFFVLGGIFAGWFTATESAGIGACGALALLIGRRRLTWKKFYESLYDAARTTAIIFALIIGAMIFTEFLNYTGAHQGVLDFILNSGLSPFGIILGICAIYVVLGALMDELSMILLTVPIFFPVVTGLGFDPIWFGILLIALCEIGLICPPIGLNLFVVRDFAPDVPISKVIIAIVPFIISDIIRVLVLAIFPALALWLPSKIL
jgi:tripartite ATP-independent transporter DctM subunit